MRRHIDVYIKECAECPHYRQLYTQRCYHPKNKKPKGWASRRILPNYINNRSVPPWCPLPFEVLA